MRTTVDWYRKFAKSNQARLLRDQHNDLSVIIMEVKSDLSPALSSLSHLRNLSSCWLARGIKIEKGLRPFSTCLPLSGQEMRLHIEIIQAGKGTKGKGERLTG